MIWSVEVVYGCVWHCVSVMLLWKCAAAVLGVAVPIVCDVVVDVVVHVIVPGGRLEESEGGAVLGCLGDGGVFDRSKVEVEVVWVLSKVVAKRKTWC